MAKAKTESTRPRRRFNEAKWRTELLARDLYTALIVKESKEDSEAVPGITWDMRCESAARQALTAARVFDQIRKVTK